ncbi:hypothetical protein K490DRAFT_73196 [Saccharata proteae CBS 121410]|uniref:Actin binding protein-like protein n=1 Tax=Saccharata proteae CBS 121410 TaxID=1314787 RepID=A0A9P4HXF6_9PEZI|nr:hypothetical protein K490DRAFT_73196 [Saccharata proteae CBS 121410]
MATLNMSSNGPNIKSSYQSVVNAPPPSGAAASSPTYGQWALFSVSAPLANAFQPDSGKESVLKVQTKGEGELADLIEELSDGRIQFAFVKVKDPNSGLPKCVLIAWCGEGVPERTKGYFMSHLAAVSKLLHGYHVQVTARSESAISPEGIIQKVADSSGSKYGGGPQEPAAEARAPPPVATKPVFTPTRVGGGGGFAPLGRARGAAPSAQNVDQDGWGDDAPPVTRSQLEKVAPAYKPTKVNMAELASQKQEPSRFAPAQENNGPSDVVKGGYQPIGKVDIGAIRKQAQESGSLKDDRPAVVKGSYEPVGKVDIAAIRAKASGPGVSSPPASITPSATGGDEEETPKSLAERSAAFKQSERLTSMPKPKVANKFGSSTGSFMGTKAPTPVGLGPKPTASAPVGIASRTFADEGGKTPAQLWAEKKARERGYSGASETAPPAAPLTNQPSGSGGWQSGYVGKKWGEVKTTHTGGSNLSAQRTGPQEPQEEETPSSPAGGISAIRDRFKGAAPMGAAAPALPGNRPVPEPEERAAPPPPPMDFSSKPNAGASIPGLPARPAQPEEDDVPAEEHFDVPPPPQQPRSPTPESPELRPSSPIRIVQPVARSAEPEPMEAPEERYEPPAMPTQSLSNAVSASRDMDDEPQVEAHDPARGAAEAAAEVAFGAGAGAAQPGTQAGGKRAVAQYDYEKAEENELELQEGEIVTNIDMVDDDWWMGQNSRGETGLFPSNYVELVEDDEHAAPPPPAAAPAPPAAPPAAKAGPTATAQYEYEAAEENELSFPDGATIMNVEFPDEDWWFGEYNGKSGLFPANYVQLDE